MIDRETTYTGMKRVNAVLAKTGPMKYLRREIGLPGDGHVIINRTKETLFHPDTLKSLRGMPVTINHPDRDIRVTADNYKEYTVGSTLDPYITGNQIQAELLIGDADAQIEMDSGKRQISMGYDHTLRQIRDNEYDTVGPLLVNHVALVERGRSGPTVTVTDVLPIELEGIENMDEKDLASMIASAVKDALPAPEGKAASVSEDAIAKAVLIALKPMQDTLTEIQNQSAKDEAEAKAKAFEVEIVKRERERAAVIVDALPFIPEDKRSEFVNKEPKDVLVAALGDSVPDAANQSIDYLRGALASKKAIIKQTASNTGSNSILPYDGSSAGGAQDSFGQVSNAYQEYVKSLETSYQNNKA